ncbi:hypothetical protein BaRGS_00037721 [Batillaria attramentaria]|uniref:Transmembrane protein 26 n=1 Tax=Batillaria attramentaria TaxID=370345 RepID=A0ABD0J897_9CAEN
MGRFGRLQALIVRFFLTLHFVLVVWRVTEFWGVWYWFLAAAIVPFLFEGAYTVVKRKGVEWQWFSPCFFCYIAATLPGIWLLEIHRTNKYQAANITTIAISGVEIPIRLSADKWVVVVEELMLYLMILGRWLLPRGEVGREQLSQLLFAFIGIASDIMELFSLFDEDMIRQDTIVTYFLLGVWSWSIVQFTLTFHAAHKPRRARGLQLSTQIDPHLENRNAAIRVELGASLMSLFMQDGPFLALRLYCMVTYDLITYSLVFFTAKNTLVILLLLYKITILLSKRFCPARLDEFEHVLGGEKDRKTRTTDKKDARLNGAFGDMDVYDLQLVIDGPATEAKKKDKDKDQFVETVSEDTILAKDKEEKDKGKGSLERTKGGKKEKAKRTSKDEALDRGKEVKDKDTEALEKTKKERKKDKEEGGVGDNTTRPNGSAVKDAELMTPKDVEVEVVENGEGTRHKSRTSDDSGMEDGIHEASVPEVEPTEKATESGPHHKDETESRPPAQALIQSITTGPIYEIADSQPESADRPSEIPPTQLPPTEQPCEIPSNQPSDGRQSPPSDHSPAPDAPHDVLSPFVPHLPSSSFV